MSMKLDIQIFAECFPFLREMTNFSFDVNKTSASFDVNKTNTDGKTHTRNRFDDVWNPIIYTVLGLIIVVINLIIIIGIWKTNKKFSLSNKLFILWSIFDLLTGIVVIPMELLEILRPFSEVCSTYAITMFLVSVTNGFNTSTFILISIIRNLLIRAPLRNIRTRNVVFASAISLSIVLAKSSITFLTYSQKYTSFGLLLVYWMLMPAWLCLEILMLVSLNTLSQVSLTRNSKLRKTMKLGTAAPINTRSGYERKAVNTLLLISLSYSLCHVTTASYYIYCLYKLWNLQDDPHGFASIKFTFGSFHVPLLLGPALNGLIFVLKNGKIKKYYRNLCRCKNRIETK